MEYFHIRFPHFDSKIIWVISLKLISSTCSSWSHLSHWTWNKGYHRYRYVCFTSWPTPRNWKWGVVNNETLRQRIWFQISIVNFTFICSNIPAAPAYGVYISQLIQYSRACGFYHAYLDRWLLLIMKLLNKGFLMVKLKSSPWLQLIHDLSPGL